MFIKSRDNNDTYEEVLNTALQIAQNSLWLIHGQLGRYWSRDLWLNFN